MELEHDFLLLGGHFFFGVAVFFLMLCFSLVLSLLRFCCFLSLSSKNVSELAPCPLFFSNGKGFADILFLEV